MPALGALRLQGMLLGCGPRGGINGCGETQAALPIVVSVDEEHGCSKRAAGSAVGDSAAAAYAKGHMVSSRIEAS